MKKSLGLFVSAAAVCFSLASCQTGLSSQSALPAGNAAPSQAAIASPVVFKFATVGDSRGQANTAGNSAQDERWLQATGIWSRMLSEIEAQKPQALVFNGDMINGYTQDMAVIDRQYAFWRGMVVGLMERGTYVVPVPGNHEVQMPFKNAEGITEKRALITHENAWRDNMGDLIVDPARWARTTKTTLAAWNIENTPKIGADGVTTDQRQLSYSFDAGNIHMAIINTDPVGFDESAPVVWLEQDLAAAKARGAKHFYVFGHKPAFTYFVEAVGAKDKATDKATDKEAMPSKKARTEDGFGSRAGLRERFWAAIETYNATYFCGHQHVYHSSQPTRAAGGRSWQVIVGSAGSPLSIKAGTSKNPFDTMYAWAEVSVRANGTAFVRVNGFDSLQNETRLLEQFELSR